MANSSTQLNQRLSTVEQDVSLLKRMFFAWLSKQTTVFQNDEQVWKAIKKDYEKIQEKMLKKYYPALYDKIGK